MAECKGSFSTPFHLFLQPVVLGSGLHLVVFDFLHYSGCYTIQHYVFITKLYNAMDWDAFGQRAS